MRILVTAASRHGGTDEIARRIGAELEKVFDAIESGQGDPHTPGSFLGLGTPVLPPLPMHGGDRNRTSPFAFTGNKFEFRALGSSMSLAFPNTVLNTIVAEAIEELANQVEAKIGSGDDIADAVSAVVKESYAANKQVCFSGDNYDEAWHAEAEKRGLKNLRTTPDALPEVTSEATVRAFEEYGVLTESELESRYEVWIEQYVTRANIEAETAADIARTMILPAALRYLALIEDAEVGALADEVKPRVDELISAAHEAGMRVVIASNDESVLHGIAADDAIPEGDAMRGGIRRLQREGRVVCLVATGASPGLRTADVAIGLLRAGEPTPWASHVVCKQDLSDVRFLIRASVSARKIAKQSVNVALGAATAGALVSAGGVVPLTTRRVLAVVPARGGSKGLHLKNLRWLGGCASVPVADGPQTAAGVWELARAKHLSPPALRVRPRRPWLAEEVPRWHAAHLRLAAELAAGRLTLVQSPFEEIAQVTSDTGFEQVDAILLDLGVSRFQLDQPERGFSAGDVPA